MASTYQKLGSYTVPLGSGVSSITFSGIPATHTDLLVHASLRTTNSSTVDDLRAQFNGDSNPNYTIKTLYGQGTNAYSGSENSVTSLYLAPIDGATAVPNVFGSLSFVVTNYLGSTFKSVSVEGVHENNATYGTDMLNSGIWKNTAPINSVTFVAASGANFVTYSEITLYGVFNTDVSSTPSTPTVSTLTDIGGGTISAAITNSGSASASYTVTSSPGGFTGTGTSPVYVSGLSPATAYTFTATAANPVGVSSASSASSSITPYNGMVALQTVTATTSSTLSLVQFTSIPSNYTHLQIRIYGRSQRAAATDTVYIRFNSDTAANYSWHQMSGTGTGGASSTGASPDYQMFAGTIPGASSTTGFFGSSIVDILDYTNTNKNKTLKSIGGYDANGSGLNEERSGAWYSTSSITSITLANYAAGDYFTQGTVFTLYGVK